MAIPFSAGASRPATRFGVLLGAALAAVLVLWAAPARANTYAASTPTVASFGATDPFAGCTADNAAAQESVLGSVLYPAAEPEPQAAVNPVNPLNIAGAYHEDRWSDGGDRGLASSATHDGGVTWTQTVVPGITKCSGGKFDRASDPWVSFGPTGTLYGIWLVFDVFDTDNGILVSKSTDGGTSWSPPITVNEDQTNGDDKESITADPYNANNVYAVWDRFLAPPSLRASDMGRFHAQSFVQQAYFSRTTNGGASWEAPRVLYNPGTQAGTIGNIITVLPNQNHTLVDGFIQFATHKAPIRGASIAINRSFNQGQTWEKKATIISRIDPNYLGPFDPDNPSQFIRGGELPAFAVNSATGVLYAVWEDDVTSPGIDEIRFSQSSDGGSTWSVPIKINQTPTNIPLGDQQAFTPEVSVAADGTVGVTYYDLRNNTSAPGLTTDYWMIHCHGSCSSPGSWAGNETHVGGPFDLEQAANAGGYFLGDYEGLVSIGNSFGSFFDQAINQATNPSDVFYSLVSPTP
jgi:hypothetical protein